MEESFKQIRFTNKSLRLIDHCEKIVQNYLQQNLRLTLRQLFYQLVSQNVIKNEERAYKNLNNLMRDARLAGMIDWDAIEDRLRIPVIPSEFNDLRELIDAALNSYRLPRWKDQPFYIELWTEKDALAGVLKPLADQFHVPLMVNRGYISTSALYEASKRFFERGDEKDKVLLYLGDFDPSGEDMVRDISDRLATFDQDQVSVQKIAIIPEQVRKYSLPPNPTKKTDPRSKAFIEKYGASSWEVDAINPEELQRIVKKAIVDHLDQPAMNKIIEQEKQDKTKLARAVKRMMKKRGGDQDAKEKGCRRRLE